MELAFLRFFESLPSAVAVGLLLLPRLIGEDGARVKRAVAALAFFRVVLGFFLIQATARAIIPAEKSIDYATLADFILHTTVGKAWAVTQAIASAFAAVSAARVAIASSLVDTIALGLGLLVTIVVSVTGHAVDDSLPLYTKASFLLHTGAGLTWLGGLIGLVWWMYTGRSKPPEIARQLAERWSFVAKLAMAVVVLSGLALAWENVGGFANLLATTYGRLLTLKLAFLCAVLLLALALARYITQSSEGAFDVSWYARIGAYEAGFGVSLLFLAGWIAVITPAAHETELYWPLPFRLSWAATWGYKVPTWSPTWWWGVSGLALVAVAAADWFAPFGRAWRRISAPMATIAGFVCLVTSFAVEAYPDTYNDPAEDYTAESIARGQAEFAENCTGCHGAGGEGNGVMAKDLRVPPADLTAPHVGTHTIGDIFHWLTFGGQSGVMPAFAEQLQPDDRWDLINFLLILSSTNQSRFIGPKGMIQWLVAPDFALVDPADEITTLAKLRGTPTLLSFAHCDALDSATLERARSLELAHDAVKAAGANHVTIYAGECPAGASGRTAVHPKAVESAYSIINRYPNEPYAREISEAHFLIDRSGFVRARFRRFSPNDESVRQLRSQIAMMASEPLVTINLHSH
jgi:putative copper resistance protein D